MPDDILDYELELGTFNFSIDVPGRKQFMKMTGISKQGQLVRVHITTDLSLDQAQKMQNLLKDMGFIGESDDGD